MIAFPDAQRAILEACRALEAETVPLAAAVGRVVALQVTALDDLVPYARSAMDGYAVFAADLAVLPATLPIAGAVFAAPAAAGVSHRRGTATAIATGAALPPGADTVVPIEDVVFDGGAIRVTAGVHPGDAVFPPGDDARAGDVLVERGTVVTPAMLGILAAGGHAHIVVHRRPRASIICSGDELVAIDEIPRHGQLRNSNAALLAATLSALGAEVRSSVTLTDDRAQLRAALAAALVHSDLVVTTGGASIGERDYVKAVCADLGVRFVFNGVALRPSKPAAFGILGRTAVAVLPGNPAAAFVGLHQFVHPAMRAICGARELLLPRLNVTLEGRINAKPERHFAAFAALAATPDGLVARPLENQCSSLTRTLAETCGFIMVPPGTRTYRTGDMVAFDVVDWSKLLPQASLPEYPSSRSHSGLPNSAFQRL